jgi:choline dehydrogenase
MDYDHWESIGNYGWGSENVLRYFIRSEDMRDPVQKKNKRFHSKGGPLSVEKPHYQLPIGDTFLEACRHLGLAISEDFAGVNQMGFGWRHQERICQFLS